MATIRFRRERRRRARAASLRVTGTEAVRLRRRRRRLPGQRQRARWTGALLCGAQRAGLHAVGDADGGWPQACRRCTPGRRAGRSRAVAPVIAERGGCPAQSRAAGAVVRIARRDGKGAGDHVRLPAHPQAVRQADRQLPGAAAQGGRHLHPDRGDAVAGVSDRGQQRSLSHRSRAGRRREGQGVGGRADRHPGLHPASRRDRLHRRARHRPLSQAGDAAVVAARQRRGAAPPLCRDRRA